MDYDKACEAIEPKERYDFLNSNLQRYSQLLQDRQRKIFTATDALSKFNDGAYDKARADFIATNMGRRRDAEDNIRFLEKGFLQPGQPERPDQKPNIIMDSLPNLNWEDVSALNIKPERMFGTYQAFKKEMGPYMERIFEDLVGRLKATRFPPKVKAQHNELITKWDKIVKRIDETTKQDPMRKVLVHDMQRLIMQLDVIDCTVLDIAAELSIRLKELMKPLLLNFAEFYNKTQNILNNFDGYSLSSDHTLRLMYENIELEDEMAIRTNRYGMKLTNGILGTLREGRAVPLLIIDFMSQYFNEKAAHRTRLKNVPPVMFLTSLFFENLINGRLNPRAPEYYDYGKVKELTAKYKGLRNTVFHNFQRLVFLLPFTDINFAVVEVRNYPEREIVIYDTEGGEFDGVHPLIFTIMKKWITDELIDKSGMNLDRCILEAKEYNIRNGGCPQCMVPFDSGVAACEMMNLISENQQITINSFGPEDTRMFRYVLFNCLVRIGLNETHELPFNLLL
jgi:hypothetical protein